MDGTLFQASSEQKTAKDTVYWPVWRPGSSKKLKIGVLHWPAGRSGASQQTAPSSGDKEVQRIVGLHCF